MKMYGFNFKPQKLSLEYYYEFSAKGRRRMKRWIHKIARMNFKKDLKNENFDD